MPADENVKEALEKLEKMGYDIEEYDQGYIACILDRSKVKDSETDSDEHPESDSSFENWIVEIFVIIRLTLCKIPLFRFAQDFLYFMENVMKKGNVITSAYYADNKIYEVGIDLSLTPYDLFEISKREDYQSLKAFLHNYGILNKRNLTSLDSFEKEVQENIEFYRLQL